MNIAKAYVQDPTRDALLEFYPEGSDTASTCAVLTPMIKSSLDELRSGQVLEVRVNDPLARGDVEAWSRLSGNTLLSRRKAFMVERPPLMGGFSATEPREPSCTSLFTSCTKPPNCLGMAPGPKVTSDTTLREASGRAVMREVSMR